MFRYIILRLLFLIPTIFTIIFVVFGLFSLIPGDPVQLIFGPNITPENYEIVKHQMGLDKPFLIRFIDYMNKLIIHRDMGKSFKSNRLVISEILERFPVTLKVTISAILIAILIGVSLGIVASVKQYSLFDITGTSIAMVLASVPGFWLGLIAILIFSLKLNLLPAFGSESWKHLILPSLTLAFPEAAVLLRITRTTMLETIRQDYIRTARAKGQIERKIIFRHALRNAQIPIITVAGIDMGYLFGGAVIIEAVYSLNGLGTLVLQSIRMKDTPMLMGSVIVLSTLFMIIMLFVDIFYAYIDPRIKTQYQKF